MNDFLQLWILINFPNFFSDGNIFEFRLGIDASDVIYSIAVAPGKGELS